MAKTVKKAAKTTKNTVKNQEFTEETAENTAIEAEDVVNQASEAEEIVETKETEVKKEKIAKKRFSNRPLFSKFGKIFGL